ncbi:GH1 family beta-glucosidase [Piscinibacter sp.]|jgi:beta-glucosidase|uniref:GH1 family beta-glucosidase n=1 Tax=Piscinibacter sp. TaxID=1903157 RepID=UPI002F3F0869
MPYDASLPPARPFLWGAATSAYQIEGAAAEDGRGPSIWDTFCRIPGAIADASSGDIACDHYHRLDSDLDLMRGLGLQAYRFSVSWSRVQPAGAGAVNPPGLGFYDRLVDGLLERAIAPYLTLYHWDLPQALQDRGGWGARDTALRFADYAALVGRRLGDRVASIATHNEPGVVAELGHQTGVHAPGLRERRLAMQVTHHLLLGHGLAVQALRAVGTRLPLGIVLSAAAVHPATGDAADVAQARLEDGLRVRWTLDALMHGRYPADVLEHLGADAPSVRGDELDSVRAPIDFIGLNYYTRTLASAKPRRLGPAPRVVTDMGWEVVPQGLTELLLRLHRDYRLPPIYITECGAACRDRLDDGRVHDAQRVDFIRQHIAAVERAVDAGVDVRGFFVWSLLDNFEWAHGYSKRFGLVYVDYPTQRRVLKDSALWYREFIASRQQQRA